jgi:ribosome-associated translation inhibitor RaiA
MQVPLQISLRDLGPSEALEARIRHEADKLETFHPRITSCRVVVERLPKHRHQGRPFEIHVDVRVPGHAEVVSTLHRHEDVYVALRDAFESVARRLEDVARIARGDVKRHAVPSHGRILRLFPDDGCGFIESTDGRELWFSRENVVHPAFEHLVPGMPVQFLEEAAAEGWQAKRVSAHAPATLASEATEA